MAHFLHLSFLPNKHVEDRSSHPKSKEYGMITNLTEKILQYQKTGLDGDQVLHEIARFIYLYPQKRYGWDEDECSDFFTSFYPRISSLIQRYRYNGKPFEVFLAATLRFRLRSFAAKRKRAVRYDKLISTQMYWETAEQYARKGYVPSDMTKETVPRLVPKARPFFRANSEGKITDFTSKRRLLFLALCSSMQMSGIHIEAVARAVNSDPTWLFSCTEELKIRLRARRERLLALQSRRNRSFVRLYQLHSEIQTCCEPGQRDFIAGAVRREKDRIVLAGNELTHVPVTPTHKDIAEVLRIPKGSVDSAMHYVKHALNELFSESAETNRRKA